MNKYNTTPRSQGGAALLVVLMLLLIMTLLGLASLRVSMLEERMTAGLLDRSLGFQGAEAALREAEAFLLTRPTFPTAGCSAGLCAQPVATATERWLDPNFGGWRTATVSLGGPALAPQYIIESMGDAPNSPGCDQQIPVPASCVSPRFRITARSAAAGRAQVTLQSNFTAL